MTVQPDWCPTISLRFMPGGQTLVGDFDTGAPTTFISFEWLIENGVMDRNHIFVKALVRSHGMPSAYQYSSVRFTASLISEDSVLTPGQFTARAVLNWENSPFCRADRNRVALIGRNILKDFGATVELSGVTGQISVTTQSWETFENEVADLFRALGLGVKRNYNLAGNQIDVFLTERTASGKDVHTVVECKFHQRPVGIKYIRQLVSVFDFARSQRMADHAVLVSSSGFSKDAHLVAETVGIELLEISDLRARASVTRNKTSSRPPLPPTSASLQSTERTAFVIMPFRDEYRDLYMLGIRDTLATHGYVCRRADEVEFTGRIMDQILDLITTSDVIVAEVSQHNPNVYYELGISHALEKNVVLCTSDAGDLPFDTRDLNHIVYSDIVDLREKLSVRIGSLIIPISDDETRTSNKTIDGDEE